MPLFSPYYSLRKSHRILRETYKLYKKKGGKLPKDALSTLEAHLQELDTACLKKDRIAADKEARWVDNFASTHLKKNILDYSKEFIFALLFALAIATIVRQSWFEIYEIPTGSMRPTFKEQDDLTVSKTAFGLNIPLKTDHFVFYPDLVKRGGTIIFTGDGIDLPDTDTNYFGIFPAKKRYTKRMIGKPGDSLYFYGGQIYGIDSEGKPIDELINSEWMKKIEHVPFLSFEGRASQPSPGEYLIKHMNIPLGRLIYTPKEGGYLGEIYKDGKWIKEDLNAEKSGPSALGDFFGMGNFAKVRLLTKEELPEKVRSSSIASEGVLFLEIAHFPNLTYPKPRFNSHDLAFEIFLEPERSYLPLKEEHLKKIQENMYTARFVVKNQYGKRYNVEKDQFTKLNPKMKGVPDGTYEFYFGKGHQIGFWGISKDLPKDSPLYSSDPKNIQLLFNLGMDFINFHEPGYAVDRYFPNRYAYFRDGDLYLLGAPILKKDDPVLLEFVKNEEAKKSRSSKDKPYIPFVDRGPPLKDGIIDKEFIERFGLKVPEKQYLVLGDNHAMSADSRIFGFVPQQNLQGVPSLIIWPPGDRMGPPFQKAYPLLTPPRLIVWSIASLIAILSWIYFRRRRSKPTFVKQHFDK